MSWHVTDACTSDCEAMPVCTVCGRRKQPHGRSAPLDSDYCHSTDCDGYTADPEAGHLWPGELAQARGDG